jgi:4'-phosphopantetheinyl transferase
LLSADEQQRWAAFRHDGDRALYLVAHTLIRLVIAQRLGVPPSTLVFSAICSHCGGNHGKPRLRSPGAPIELSLSHSGNRVVVAISRDTPVGVDIERISTDTAGLDAIDAMLSHAEQEAIVLLPPERRQLALARYWTRKEAVLKATGDGLGVQPCRLTVTVPDMPPALLSWDDVAPPDRQIHLCDLDAGTEYVACLAMLGARLRVAEYDGSALLLANAALSL